MVKSRLMLEFSKMDSGHIHLKINMYCMHIYGVFKINFKNPIASFLFNHVYSKFLMCILITFVAAQYVEIYNTIDEGFFSVVSILGVSLLYTVTVWKINVCKSEKISKLVEQIRNTEVSMMNYNNQHIKDIYYRYVRWNYAADKLFIWVGVFTIPPFFINPILLQMTEDFQIEKERMLNLTGHFVRPLPLRSWFPLDRDRFYYLVYAYDVLVSMTGGGLTVVVDIFIVGLITYAIGQIKILQYSLRNSKLLAANLAKNNPGMTQEDAVRISIHHSIHMHKVVIRYVWTLDSALSKLMLFDFAIASLQMAMLGMQIVMSRFGLTQLFALEYLASMLTQLFLVYWGANELMLESLGISQAIWESDWMDYSHGIKKTLLVVMMRSQRPMALSVGPFYEMSMQTALTILRASYSYVAVLRQMYMIHGHSEE